MEEVVKRESEQSFVHAKKEGEVERVTIQDQIVSLIPLAGTIELTKEQEESLYSPVVVEDVEIRPDGLIYLPWMEYVTRLRKAFGMSWSLIPHGQPTKVGNFIHWPFWLIIRGKPYAFAVGEQQYFANDRMTYGDALEGAKSNALMRLCKGLGISLELWKPSFVKEWKAKFAESYSDGGKTKWKKKGSLNENGKTDEETHPSSSPQSSDPGPGEEPQQAYKIKTVKKAEGKNYYHIETTDGSKAWAKDPKVIEGAQYACENDLEVYLTVASNKLIEEIKLVPEVAK